MVDPVRGSDISGGLIRSGGGWKGMFQGGINGGAFLLTRTHSNSQILLHSAITAPLPSTSNQSRPLFSGGKQQQEEQEEDQRYLLSHHKPDQARKISTPQV